MNEKNKAILLVSLIIFSLSGAFLYQGIVHYNKAIDQALQMAEENMNSTIRTVEEFSFAPYVSRIRNLLAANPFIIEAFAKRDRELLYQRALPKYTALQRENEYFQVMHFHLPDSTTFLRMHKPDFYGDDLKNIRPIVDAVHARHKPMTGYEFGRHGPFYRIVHPVFHKGAYIGALEFGIKAHQLTAVLESRIDDSVTSFFRKENWQKATGFATDKQITFDDFVLLTHDNPLYSRLPADLHLDKGDQRITIDDHHYIFHSHPFFKNFQNKTIGGLIVLQDISPLLAGKKEFVVKAVIFTCAMLLLALVVLYLTFGRMIGAMVAEVAARQKAEKNAYKAKKEWERTFDAVPDMIAIINDRHEIVRANKAMAAKLGMSVQQLVHTKYYRSVHGSDSPPSYCPHTRLLEDRQPHSVEVFDEGLNCHLDITVSPIHDGDGQFFGSVHVARDVTAQKKAEEEKAASEARLRKAEKMEAIGLMAGGVAHDLNNILSGIVSYPELLLMKLDKDSELRQLIEAIQESGKRAAAVVSDLLTVARGVAAARETANLNTLIGEYLDSPECRKLRSLHPNVTCSMELEPELLNISCSPVHIMKCLMNLVTNGAEAILSGEGCITISTRKQYVEKAIVGNELMERGEYVVLSVSDTGSGIPEKDVNRIFEPFYSKKVMGRSGTGLGLAVVWNTVEDHGGGITVDSSDKGTTFELYFPATREDLAVQPESISLDELKGNHEKILVVDDEPQQRDVATQMLTSLNYHTHSVGSGEEAVAYLQENSVDLVILDMIMDPGMNGRHTYEHITKLYPGQKAIIVSGFSINEEVKKAQKLGAGQFVRKPYTMNQLGAAVMQNL